MDVWTGVDPGTTSDADLETARSVALASFLGAVLFSLMATLHGVRGEIPCVWVSAATATALACVPFGARRFPAVRVGDVACAVFFAGVAALTVARGGNSLFTLVFGTVIVVTAYGLRGIQASLAWSTALLGLWLAVAGASANGWLTPGHYYPIAGVPILPFAALAALLVASDQRKRQQDTLSRNAEHRFTSLFRSLPLGTLLIGPDARIVEANVVAAKLMGAERTDLRGTPMGDFAFFATPDFQALLNACFDRSVGGTAELVVPREAGDTLLRVQVSPWLDSAGAPAGAQAVLEDVTAARETEQQLRERETRYRLILDHTGAIIIEADRHGIVTWTTPNCEVLTGIDVVGKELAVTLGTIHDDDQERVFTTLAAAVQSGRPGRTEAFRMRDAGGNWKWIETSVAGYTDRRGDFRLVSTNHDVTERIEATDAIALRDARTRALLENVAELIVEMDVTGRVTAVSKSSLAVTGIPQEEFTAETYREGVHPDDRAAVRASFARTIDDAQGGNVAYRFKTPLGEWRWLETSGSLYQAELDEDARVTCVTRDITTRVETEQRTRHSQKLEAVGKLAGGVAHDFNNLLTIVLGTAERLLADPEVETREAAEVIVDACERGSGLTGQLLTFSRSEPARLQPGHVGELVESIAPMLGRLIPEDIALAVHTAPDLPAVRVDADLFSQVVVNLVVNARDAMPRGGVLDLRTAPSADGRWVEIRVSDTGVGMESDVAERAFDPFYTTKGPGKGTGLGLATVYGAMRKMSGEVDLVTKPGEGSTVRLRFARTDEVPEAPVVVPPATTHGGGEAPATILVAEDDPQVRAVMVETLERDGYRVIACEDGRIALERSEQEPLDLLVSDVVMPHRDGVELVREVHARHPEVPALLVTGHARDAGGRDYQLEEFPVLRKPFRPQELSRRVAALLSESRKEQALSRPPAPAR
jgi:hypothetical protein